MVAIVKEGTLTTDMTVVTQTIVDKLTDAADEFGLAGVYYGLQELIPEYPAVCVESFPKRRVAYGTHSFNIELSVGLLVYHGKIQSSTITKKSCEEMSERIQDRLHEDFYLGGLVLFGYVSRIDPGVSRVQEVMIRSTRIIWEATSKERYV